MLINRRLGSRNTSVALRPDRLADWFNAAEQQGQVAARYLALPRVSRVA